MVQTAQLYLLRRRNRPRATITTPTPIPPISNQFIVLAGAVGGTGSPPWVAGEVEGVIWSVVEGGVVAGGTEVGTLAGWDAEGGVVEDWVGVTVVWPGGGVVGTTGALVTVRVSVPDILLTAAVMVVIPAARPLARPGLG